MKCLKLFCYVVLIAMLVVTVQASLDRDVFTAAKDIIADPWGIATLFDTYFAFLFFYFWIWSKETCPVSRGLWLVLTLCLGNFAMATYVLIQLAKRPATVEELLTAKNQGFCKVGGGA